MTNPDRRRPNTFLLYSLTAFGVMLALFLSVPLLSLVATSLRAPDVRGLTLANFRTLFQQDVFMQGLSNSVTLSFWSSAIAMAVGLVCAYALTRLGAEGTQRRLMLVLNMAANFNGLSLALSFLLMLGGSGVLWTLLERLGVARTTLSGHVRMVLCYTYFQIPMAVLLLYPVYCGIRRDWREASMMLGAYGRDFWLRVGIPAILPSLFSTFTILFAHAMGAYAAAYQLAAADYPLAPLQIGVLMTGGSQAQSGLGSALAVLLSAALV
ncbi:MAG: ABC transporter permease, partial [Clostridia bacterium]